MSQLTSSIRIRLGTFVAVTRWGKTSEKGLPACFSPAKVPRQDGRAWHTARQEETGLTGHDRDLEAGVEGQETDNLGTGVARGA